MSKRLRRFSSGSVDDSVLRLLPHLRDGDELREDQRERSLERRLDASLALAGEDLLEGPSEIARKPRVDERIEHRVQMTGPGEDGEHRVAIGRKTLNHSCCNQNHPQILYLKISNIKG